MSSGDEFVDVDRSDSSSLDDSDLDELLQDDEMEDRAKLLNRGRGSVMGRNHTQRNRLLSHEQLMGDYFAEVPTYPPHLFRRRYRMWRSLFVKIVKACEANSNYFKQRRNVVGVMGFSPFQKKICCHEGDCPFLTRKHEFGEPNSGFSVRIFTGSARDALRQVQTVTHEVDAILSAAIALCSSQGLRATLAKKERMAIQVSDPSPSTRVGAQAPGW
nr:uncharacterized protein LOC127328494 [Lolium perenne]